MMDVCYARGQLDVIEKILALPLIIKEYQKGLKNRPEGGLTEMKKVEARL